MSLQVLDARQTLGVRIERLFGRTATVADTIKRIWFGWSLARQFATCASIVLLPAMTLMGVWVSGRIQESVTHSAATSAALYMENFVEPLVKDLANGNSLSPENVAALGDLLKNTSLGQKILTFKIWGPQGVIIGSSRPELVGQRFEPSVGLKKAWTGDVVSEFDQLKDAENEFERNTGIPLLELYMPIRARGTDRIIAVGEFYEKADDLKVELDHARLMSWLMVAAMALSMLSALFAIVRRGSQTIEQQRVSLEQRVADLTRLLDENTELRARAHRASARASESNEGYLRRLGADLHDGPAQLISLALLRLDDGPIRPAPATVAEAPSEPAMDRICVRSVLGDALKEIRNIAAGLAVPEIDDLSLSQSIGAVVERHMQLTGTQVALSCGALPGAIGPALKLCIYRFVQEGLNNAYRHAGGIGQSVGVHAQGNAICVVVADRGEKVDMVATGTTSGLGLRGLSDRIESLGGTLKIERGAERGTTLTAQLPLATGETSDE